MGKSRFRAVKKSKSSTNHWEQLGVSIRHTYMPRQTNPSAHDPHFPSSTRPNNHQHLISTHARKQKAPVASPPKIPRLDRPQANITDGAKRKGELETDVASIPRQTDPASDGADEPNLSHAQDGTHDAKAEGGHGGDAGRELGGLVVDLDVVAEVAALEDEVFAEGDAFVDGEPVALRRGGVLMMWCECDGRRGGA